MILSTLHPYTVEGRVQSLFGTYIPPKRVFKANRYLTLRFKLTGLIPSKKNDYYSENNIRWIVKQAIANHGISMKAFAHITTNAKSWIRGSKKYLEWLDDITPTINEQKKFWEDKYRIKYPLEFVSIKTYYFFADRTARDFINKDESVYDMLVQKGIIADDNYGVLYKTASDGGCYKGEINDHICTIDITLALFDV
jgi:hypothetical protein